MSYYLLVLVLVLVLRGSLRIRFLLGGAFMGERTDLEGADLAGLASIARLVAFISKANRVTDMMSLTSSSGLKNSVYLDEDEPNRASSREPMRLLWSFFTGSAIEKTIGRRQTSYR
eukprot:TRINITY_DN7065_c0_g1_i1.p2 TRINITY_DN7065_c0_g1~~TRINITY_DN7065_c0_g1_i1.p2  ORF type:complete len:116 (-),score=8.53 TRINITY_DN7065_c0_g1_i1:150-497(-)